MLADGLNMINNVTLWLSNGSQSFEAVSAKASNFTGFGLTIGHTVDLVPEMLFRAVQQECEWAPAPCAHRSGRSA